MCLTEPDWSMVGGGGESSAAAEGPGAEVQGLNGYGPS